MKKTILLLTFLATCLCNAQLITENLASENVGISETNPVQKLDVNGTTKTTQLIVGNKNTIPAFVNAWVEGDFATQLFLNNASRPTNERLWALSIINGNFKIFTESDDMTSIQEAFTINRGSGLNIDNILFPNGNVGIGTNSFTDGDDTYRLSINGKVRAHGVKVYTTWADYVFKPDYNLKPLDEVEAFINKNGHLPNVPSEAEVLENGIELGAMNAKLLEKIEELTLYTIQLKKEIELIKSKID